MTRTGFAICTVGAINALTLGVVGCSSEMDGVATEEVSVTSSELFSSENLPATIYDSGSSEQTFLVADFNGDQRADVLQTYRGWASIPVCLASYGGWSCSNLSATIYNSGSSEQQFLTGDFDGNGRTDVFQSYRGWASIPVCRSIGGAWSCSNLGATIHNSGSSEQQFLTGDFNGDGRTDVFQTYRGWASIPVSVSSGGIWASANHSATIYNSGSPEQRFMVADANGDGRTDIIQTYRGWNSYPTCFSSGGGWYCSNLAATIYNSGSSEQQFLTGDFNGDGRTDVFQTYRGWASIPVCLSNGAGWDCSNLPATIYNSGSTNQRFIVADMNGDGRSDIVQAYRGWASYPVCFSTGSGWSCSNLSATIFDSGSAQQRFLAGDFNGDGNDDMFQVFRGWASIPVSISW